MSIQNFSSLDLALAAACLVLLLVAGVLLARLLRRRRQCARLQKELKLQKSRVQARKEKIRELRGTLHALGERLGEDERRLEDSCTRAEIEAFYPELAQALRDLVRAAEPGSFSEERRAEVMSAAIRLSHRLQAAFRMPEEPLLALEEDGTCDKSLRPRRVLIVDDNDESLRSIADIVESSGFLAELAASGDKAVEKVRASREGYYDLILLDVIMHGKDGYETCLELRRLPRGDCQTVPVIALTANSFSEDYMQMLSAGMNDRISKPFSRDAFLTVANKWLLPREVPATSRKDGLSWSSIHTSADGAAAPGC